MKILIIFAILAVGAVALYFIGPSVLVGGPSKEDIEQISREIMSISSPEAENATITPKGLCSQIGDIYACAVEVTVEGSEPQTFVTEVQKGENGGWVPVPH